MVVVVVVLAAVVLLPPSPLLLLWMSGWLRRCRVRRAGRNLFFCCRCLCVFE